MGYLSRCFDKATAGSFLFTDRLSILAGVAVPALTYASGIPMGEAAAAYAALAVLIIVSASVFLRLITAPYFIWREDQARIAELRHELGDPRRQTRAAIERRLDAARIAVVEFLNAHRINEAVRLGNKDRLSDYPDLHKPLSLLIADEDALKNLADDLERTYAIFYAAKVIEQSSNSINCEASRIIAREEHNYTVARRRLCKFLLAKDVDQSHQPL